MKRLVLNFICKNESHIIGRMLKSTRSITDLIVAVDTGSTDNTIAKIYAHGKQCNIPTYIFERPFDNFSNSRNYALDKLREVVQELSWDAQYTWGFWIDCDDVMIIDKKFEKEAISFDIHDVYTYEKGRRYNRTEFFRVRGDFVWEGPALERLVYDCQNSSISILEGIKIIVEKKGVSWKGDLEAKFLKYVTLLKEYVNNDHRSFHWLYLIAESYFAAARVCRSNERKRDLLLEGLNYYKEIVTMSSEIREERYRSYERMAFAMKALGEDWCNVRETLLTAYSMDKRHAEPLFYVIRYYVEKAQWQIAYLYSSFAISSYHNNIPEESDIGQLIVSIYLWELIFLHSVICVNSGKIQEGKSAYSKLIEIVKERPRHFTKKDILLIRLNSPKMFIGLQKIGYLLLKSSLK